MTKFLPPRRVLLVDDVPAVRQALRWLLEETGNLLVIGEAANGPHAILQAADLLPDVVILDIELPRLDGFSVAQALKQLEHPPIIIFLTVHGDEATREHAILRGGDGFVAKGEGWEPLLAQLEKLLP